MSRKKISQLPQATTPLTGAELLEIVQGGVNKQVAKSDIAANNGGTAATTTFTPTGNISATDVQAAVVELDNEKQAALGFTPENVANKDTDGTLAANSDTKYPSQKAVKTYVDNHVVGTPTLAQVLAVGSSANSTVISSLANGIASGDAVNKGQLDTKATLLQPYNEITTANYTFVLTDNGVTVDRNVATANTITIPPNSSVAFPLGTNLIVNQSGDGVTSWVAGAGVTITPTAGTGNLNCIAKNIPTLARKVGTDTWQLINGLSAAAARSAIFCTNIIPTYPKGSTRNRYISAAITCQAWGVVGYLANITYFQGVVIGERITIDRIQIRNGTNNAGKLCRIGLYSDNGTCYPGSLVYGSTSLSLTTIGIIGDNLVSPVTIDPGLYWFALTADANNSFDSIGANSVINIVGMVSTAGAVSPGQGLSVSVAHAALPATATAGATEIAAGSAAPAVTLRAQ